MTYNKNLTLGCVIITCGVIAASAAILHLNAIQEPKNSQQEVTVSYDETPPEVSVQELSMQETVQKELPAQKNLQPTKYQMQDLDSNLAAYLHKNGYAQKAEPDKKLVIYINVYDLHCPYYEQFRKNIAAYKNSPDWTKKFTFVENRVPHEYTVINESGTKKEADEINSFLTICYDLCVIDFKNNKMLSMQPNNLHNSEELYDVLSSCYQ